MRKEDLIRIFGTDNPSVERYRDWILENDPETLRPWDPPLDSQSKAFLSDSELVEMCKNFKPTSHYSGYIVVKYENDWKQLIEKVISNLRLFQKTKERNFSTWEEIFELITDFKRARIDNLGLQMAEETREYVKTKLKLISERSGIFINKFIDSLEKELGERKEELRKRRSEMLENLKEINYSPSSLKRELFTKEEYNTLRSAIIKNIIEDMKKNPQNWEIHESIITVDLPWTASPPDSIKKKDGSIVFSKLFTSQQEWKEFKKALRSNNSFFLALSRLGR